MKSFEAIASHVHRVVIDYAMPGARGRHAPGVLPTVSPTSSIIPRAGPDRQSNSRPWTGRCELRRRAYRQSARQWLETIGMENYRDGIGGQKPADRKAIAARRRMRRGEMGLFKVMAIRGGGCPKWLVGDGMLPQRTIRDAGALADSGRKHYSPSSSLPTKDLDFSGEHTPMHGNVNFRPDSRPRRRSDGRWSATPRSVRRTSVERGERRRASYASRIRGGGRPCADEWVSPRRDRRETIFICRCLQITTAPAAYTEIWLRERGHQASWSEPTPTRTSYGLAM